MKKEKIFLNLYKEWLKKGRLPAYGLCGSLDLLPEEQQAIFKMMFPTWHDSLVLGANDESVGYWGSDTWVNHQINFGPRRQTIMLFCAALNNEL